MKADKQRLTLHSLSQRVAPPNSSWAKCGKVPRGKISIIRDIDAARRSQYAPIAVVGVVGEYATITGLCTCGSPWCVRCGAKIARHRAEELAALIANVRRGGGEVYMLSCTVPHDQGDDLAPMRAALSDAFRYVQQGHWRELKVELGIVGTIRGDDEPTWGPKGWHPHFHVLVVTERPLTPAQQTELTDYVYRRWSSRIQRHGYRAPSREHGIMLTVSRDDGYVVKLGLADELASGLYKKPRAGRLSPLGLLERYRETGDRQYIERYAEFRIAYHGRRKLTYSRGLRGRYLATPEVSDEAVAADDTEQPQEAEGVPFMRVFSEADRALWIRAIAESPDRQVELLAAARAGGEAGVDLYLKYLLQLTDLADRLGIHQHSSIESVRARIHDPPDSARCAA